MNYFYYIDKYSDIEDTMADLMKNFPVYFQEANRIEEIIRSVMVESEKNEAITIVVEEEYTDRQYRDSFYSYFSQKYTEYKRNCMRLVLFEGEYKPEDFVGEMNKKLQRTLIGSIVLRPLNVGNIGLTLIDPSKSSIHGNAFVQTGKFPITIFGRKFKIRAFPYLSQDNDCMTCAETALYNLMQYYGQKYSEYRIVMPSEILNITEEASYQRVLPSEGMDDTYIAKVLSMEHFYPRLYSGVENFRFLFHTYVESGIPFILGLPQHVVICIGHSGLDCTINSSFLNDNVEESLLDSNDNCFLLNTSCAVKGYVFMDDNKCPYTVSTLEEMVMEYFHESNVNETEEDFENFYSEEVEEDVAYSSQTPDSIEDETIDNYCTLLVPLYKRIFLDANRAKTIFDEVFLTSSQFINSIRMAYNDMDWGKCIEKPIVWRMYLASSKSYRDFRCRTAEKIDLALYYANNSFPRFIWVMELGTLDSFSKRRSRVEIILDATSSPNSNTWGILSVGYKGHHVFTASALKDKKVRTLLDRKFDEFVTESSYKGRLSDFNGRRDFTAIFQVLYNGNSDLFTDTYEVFHNYNLKEI